MPNIITHALCAQDALEKIHDIPLKTLIQKYPQVYAMASSGPDFIFYYHVMPWQDSRRNPEIYGVGNAIHATQINAFYQRALELIRLEEDPETQDILKVFLAGHLAHWSLDTLAHPFVFYRTGPLAGTTKYWHYRLESMLDTWMVKVKGFRLDKTRSYEFVASSPVNRQRLSRFYDAIVRDVYGVDLGADIYAECFASMHDTAKYLFDPLELKLPVIRKIEAALKAPWKFSSHMILGTLDTEHDILNLNHAEWAHPCDDALISTKSFTDLYQEATLRAAAGLYALNAIFYDHFKPESLNNLLQDRNYDTGLSNPPEMRFYQPIYEDLP